MRERMIFYGSFYESAKVLNEEDRLKFYEAIFQYSLEEKEPMLEGLLGSMFGLVKPVLDSQIKRAENGKKGAIYGKLGGRPKTTKEKEKKPKKAFIKPEISEIEQFIIDNGYMVNAEKFYNYYESNGWKVGKNAMKDWQACVRTWEQNINPKAPKRKEKPKVEMSAEEEEAERKRLLEYLQSD